jgi:hypothetical protein
MMEDVQKYNICTNVPSSQIFRSYLHIVIVYRLEFNYNFTLSKLTVTE